VLSTAAPPAAAPVTSVATPAPAATAPAAAPTATLAVLDGNTHDVTSATTEIHHSEIADTGHHFHHMWG
jgi:hypothetical protein